MRLEYLLVMCLPVLGQASGGSSVTKAPGETVTLTILANSQPARAPIALQWEVVFPAQLMDLEGDPEIGSAAKDASKSLECERPKPYLYRCVLSGGEKAIGDGQIVPFPNPNHRDGWNICPQSRKSRSHNTPWKAGGVGQYSVHRNHPVIPAGSAGDVFH
jgi:hypothetical protein